MYPNRESALEKLRGAQERLASGTTDVDKLSMALLKLHGALEDRLRELLAAKLPLERNEINDTKEFNWPQIVDFARAHLGMAYADSSEIMRMNGLARNPTAHGTTLNITREEVVQYESLVRALWNTGSRSGAPLPPYRGVGSAAGQAQSASGGAPRQSPFTGDGWRAGTTTYPAPKTYHQVERPWYRSTGCMVFLFVFALPVWAVMVFSDRKAGGLAKLFALLAFVVYLLGGFALLSVALGAPFFQGLELPAPAFETPALVETITAPAGTSTPYANKPQQSPLAETKPPDNPAAGCAVVWEEYDGDLAGKNRSMVWNEVVGAEVKESGLAWQEFSSLVVEKNPALAGDGYEFKAGKVYVLPRCR